jgi:hypothetical protein
MGQNNDSTEHGDLQGQQVGQVKISDAERNRQSGYSSGGENEKGKPGSNGGYKETQPRQNDSHGTGGEDEGHE